MASHFVFSLRTETGGLRRYGFRADGELAAYLVKLPNRSEFIRAALENEVARRSGSVASTGVPEELASRLAAMEDMLKVIPRLERAVAGLAASVNEVLSRVGGLEVPPASMPEPAQEQQGESDWQKVQEQLYKAMLNFGQPKGGDQA